MATQQEWNDYCQSVREIAARAEIIPLPPSSNEGFIESCMEAYQEIVRNQPGRKYGAPGEFEDNELVYHYLSDLGYEIDDITRLMSKGNVDELVRILCRCEYQDQRSDESI